MKIHAFAAASPRESLQPLSFEAPELDPFEIIVNVSHCGLCHSDIHLIDDDWKRSIYPLVPGHEIVGKIVKKGEQVALKIGQRVGISWIRSTCLRCPACLSGDTNVCPNKTTICNGHHGGFADHVVADSRFSFVIPDGLGSADAAPLLCAGATVYGPLRRYAGSPASVAVIGIGGLGHLALQFASAFGCEVTAISQTPSKEAEAKAFGATRFLSLEKNLDPMQFDFILSTVNGELDWNQVLTLLKPKGTLCFVGRPDRPAQIDISNFLSLQRTICGSSTANRAQMIEMLQFAARRNIKPKIELYPLREVNKAIERVKANKARYRVVLEV